MLKMMELSGSSGAAAGEVQLQVEGHECTVDLLCFEIAPWAFIRN